MKKNVSQRGFTLIELLVVIMIIGVLATMIGSNFLTSQRRARNAQRISTLKEIQKGFEQYYGDDNGNYAACSTMFNSTYFPQTPPATGTLGYTYTCTTVDYCICVEIQEVAGERPAANSTNDQCVFSASNPTHYCLRNLQ
jgi:prepilin-type N-terminal cleavage/methylation domain-containing protein